MKNGILTFWLLNCQNVRMAWRDATEDLMVDECAHRADDLRAIINAPYMDDAIVRRHWQRFMLEHRDDPMFSSEIRYLVGDLNRHRSELMRELIAQIQHPGE